MSGADTVNLVGVIGTWMAVGLAIIALGGVLPAYLVYQRSRTDKAQAFSLLDDPNGTFVSQGFRFLSMRYIQTIRVPDLRYPFPLTTVNPSLDLNKLGSRKSNTSWINFAYIISATFPNVKIIAGTHILIDNREVFLPVHRSWILALGVLHRYAYRSDYGLPIGATLEVDMAMLNSQRYLSGISGMLCECGQADLRNFFNPRNYNALYFDMHTILQLSQSLSHEEIPLRILIILFLGYIPMPNGEHLLAKPKSANRTPRRINRGFIDKVSIAVLSDLDGRRHREENTFNTHGLDLEVAKVKYLLLLEPWDLNLQLHLPLDIDARGMEQCGYYRMGHWKDQFSRVSDVWILKRDLHRIVLGYINFQLSPRGVLYDAQHDIIVTKVFNEDGLAKTLDLARMVLSDLVAGDQVQAILRDALNVVRESDLEHITWSRHAMIAFFNLVEAIKAVCETDDWKFQSVGVLYLCDEKFRGTIQNSVQDAAVGNQQSIDFDILANEVRLPGWNKPSTDQNLRFDFDFTNALANINSAPALANGELSLARATFATLHAHLKAIMWKMSLQPDGLSQLLETLGAVCYVSTVSPPALNARRSRASYESSGPGPASSTDTPVSERYVEEVVQEVARAEQGERRMNVAHYAEESISELPVMTTGDWALVLRPNGLQPGLEETERQNEDQEPNIHISINIVSANDSVGKGTNLREHNKSEVNPERDTAKAKTDGHNLGFTTNPIDSAAFSRKRAFTS